MRAARPRRGVVKCMFNFSSQDDYSGFDVMVTAKMKMEREVDRGSYRWRFAMLEASCSTFLCDLCWCHDIHRDGNHRKHCHPESSHD